MLGDDPPSSPRSSNASASGVCSASTGSASASATTSCARCCSRASPPPADACSAAAEQLAAAPHPPPSAMRSGRRPDDTDGDRARPHLRHVLRARARGRLRHGPRARPHPRRQRGRLRAARLHARRAARDTDLLHPPGRAARAERAARARPARRPSIDDQAHLPHEAGHVPPDRDPLHALEVGGRIRILGSSRTGASTASAARTAEPSHSPHKGPPAGWRSFAQPIARGGTT